MPRALVRVGLGRWRPWGGGLDNVAKKANVYNKSTDSPLRYTSNPFRMASISIPNVSIGLFIKPGGGQDTGLPSLWRRTMAGWGTPRGVQTKPGKRSLKVGGRGRVAGCAQEQRVYDDLQINRVITCGLGARAALCGSPRRSVGGGGAAAGLPASPG